MSAALEIVALCKRFGRTLAVDGVSAVVEPGRAVALFGPNGAGKTTFMRLCATLLRPTSGTVRVFGTDVAADGAAVRRRIAVLSHESYLYPDLTPVENLSFYARLFRVPDAARRIRTLIERMEIVGWSHRPVGVLSRGLVQRCALARVLLHEPDLLFLDEPFTGLDLDAQAILASVLKESHRAGTTLMMSTHDLASGLSLCDSAIVLARGRLVWHGAVRPSDHATFERRYRELTHPRGAAGGPPPD